jgi:MFS family permease
MQLVAQNWLVLQLTGSTAAVGVTVMLQAVPALLLGLWGGAVVDRLPRQRVLVGTQLAYGALAAVLGALALTGTVELWMVEVLAVGVGLVAVLDTPAATVLGADLVPEEDLGNAIALGSISGSAARVAGMAAAGIVIAAAGVGVVFVANAVSYLAVVAALVRIGGTDAAFRQLPAPDAGELTESMMGGDGVRAGLAYIRAHPRLPVLLALLFVLGSFGRNFQVTMAAMTADTFHAGAAAYGAASTAFAAGAVLGAVVAARLKRLGVAVLLSAAATAAGLQAVSGLAPHLTAFFVSLVPIAAAAVVIDTAAGATIQLSTRPALRGRVTAVAAIVSGAAGAVGGPVLGWLAESAGPRHALLVGGTVALVATVLAAAKLHARRAPRATPALAI